MTRLAYVANESNAPIFAWLGLIVLINAYWMVWDFVICPRTHWEMMTTELREGLNSEIFGPFLAGFIGAVPIIFIVHMWNIRTHS